jgi:hypothetical protein
MGLSFFEVSAGGPWNVDLGMGMAKSSQQVLELELL